MIRFVITVFGERYTGMLISYLNSIQKSNQKAKISIFWSDIKTEKIEYIKQTFHRVDFHKIQIPYNRQKEIAACLKPIIAINALKNIKEKYICVIDVDVLVIKNLLPLLKKINFDFIFTYKNEIIPINGGVFICKNTKKIYNFFELWKEKILEIFNSEELFSIANNQNQSYGATDQMAFQKIINYKSEKNKYNIKINGENILIIGIQCEILNEIRSTPISKITHIIHFKSEWHSILIDGGEFTKKRPWKKSKEMFLLFIKNYIDAINKINAQSFKKLPTDYFNINIPNYINKKSGKLITFKWLIHIFIYKLKKNAYRFSQIKKIKKILKGKDK